MVTFVLVKVAMHLWEDRCATKSNARDVIYGNKLYLVDSFGSMDIWNLP